MDKMYYKEYYHLERNHWWFKARLEILESILTKKILPANSNPKVLNAGVATGATTTMLEKYGTVTSLEYDKDCCTFLRESLQMEVVNASLTELPFEDESFDLVCAFDVIEHIENDTKAIQEIKRVLKKGGIVYLTVPAFPFMWSHHDVVNHHFRRYTSRLLSDLLIQQQFEMVYKNYFNSLLFPAILMFRWMSRLRPNKDQTESTGSDFEAMQMSRRVNQLFYWIFKKEKGPLTKGLRFPFGVSLMMIGKK